MIRQPQSPPPIATMYDASPNREPTNGGVLGGGAAATSITANQAYHERERARREADNRRHNANVGSDGRHTAVPHGPDPANVNYYAALAAELDRDDGELTVVDEEPAQTSTTAAPTAYTEAHPARVGETGIPWAADAATSIAQPVGARKYTAKELEAIERSRCRVYQFVSSDVPVYGIPFTEDFSTVGVYTMLPDEVSLGSLCYDQGPGWVAIHPNRVLNTSLFTRSYAAELVHTVGYKYMCDKTHLPLSVPASNYAVINPLYAKMRAKFRAAKKDPYLVNAVTAYALSMCGGTELLRQCGESTAQYYLDVVKRTQINNLRSFEERVYTTSVGPILCPDPWLHSSLAESVDMYDVHQPIRVVDVVCDLPNTHDLQYEVRADFTLKRSKDLSEDALYARHPVAGSDTRVVSIPIHPCGPLKHEGYRTVFGSLTSIPQTVYERNSNSVMYRSLARLIKAKVEDGEVLGEMECRRNALHLAHAIAVEHHAFKHSLPKAINPLNWGKIAFDESSETWKLEKMLRAGRCGNDMRDRTSIYGDMTSSSTRTSGPGSDTAAVVRRAVGRGIAKLIDGCSPSRIQKWIDGVRTNGSWAYNRVWLEYLTLFHPFLSREACANIKHIKRELRRAYVKGVKLHLDDDLMVKMIEATVKREIAKAGKNPRFVAAYDAGSMYANELPEYVKVGIDGEHTFVLRPGDGGLDQRPITLTMHIMAKPKPETLGDMFKQLELAQSTPDSIYVMIFSDDAVYSGQVNGQSFLFNADVSSNDSSQDSPAFLCAGLAMGRFDKVRARGLLKQCMLPVRVSDKEGGAGWYTIDFIGPFEGSGSVLTTILNHFGSAMIAMSFGQLMAEGYEPERALREGAGLVGHTMTMEVCDSMEDVLFLKRYPVRVGDGWVGQIAAGALVKRFGSIDGDLTNKTLGIGVAEFDAMEFSMRFEKHQSGVMKGWKHEPGNPLMNALRDKFQADTSVEVIHDSLKYVFVDNANNARVDASDAFRRRYNLSDVEIAELVTMVQRWSVGMACDCSATRKILRKDYGM